MKTSDKIKIIAAVIFGVIIIGLLLFNSIKPKQDSKSTENASDSSVTSQVDSTEKTKETTTEEVSELTTVEITTNQETTTKKESTTKEKSKKQNTTTKKQETTRATTKQHTTKKQTTTRQTTTKKVTTTKPKKVRVNRISIPSSVTLTAGSGKSLSVSVSPSNATNKKVSWSSSNSGVASVSSSGYISAKKAGSATITCSATDGSGVKAHCNVVIKNKTVYVTAIRLSVNKVTVHRGGTVRISATVLPSNATNKSVAWRSENASIASVRNGVITGKATGSTYIYCYATDGSNKSARCLVVVK